MKLLVTGAAGFIGFHTAKLLLERGDDVVGLDNLNEYYDVTLKYARLGALQRYSNFKFAKLDLADRDGPDPEGHCDRQDGGNEADESHDQNG